MKNTIQRPVSIKEIGAMFIFLSLMLLSFLATSQAAQRTSRRSSVRVNKVYEWCVRDASCEKVSHLRGKLNDIFLDEQYKSATWSVYVYSASCEEEIYVLNAEKLVMPASNMKIYTTATALMKLGPDFTYKTNLVHTGRVDQEGILHGNLVIKGCGDPTLSGRYRNGDFYAIFDEWIDSLKKEGIKSVQGDIIGDDSCFDDKTFGPGWSWDYLEDWYAAQVSGLSYNDNCLDVYVYPGKDVGAPVLIKPKPNTQYMKFKNKAVTVGVGKQSGLVFDRPLNSNEIIISGQMAIDAPPRLEWITVNKPTLYTTTVFCERLKEKGIKVTGSPYDIDDYMNRGNLSPAKTVATYESPSMAVILHKINKSSHNFFAEQVLKTLGAEVKKVGSHSQSTRVVEELLGSIGLDSTKHQVFDGSGLSRLNLVCSYGTVRLLDYMLRHEQGDIFVDSLPIAGRDGTLRGRMGGTRAADNLRAKTGSIGNARALSGYVTTRDGEQLVFSMIVNNFTPFSSSRPSRSMDKACIELANFSRN